ncbi:uncharacterized protein CCR75_003024 [Bremia lactucae]|uniref:Lysine transporter LysE n=1 Tax=Bremia lactucae TaxID=4779 RepID=A0A976IKS5_BRELC|nr:hypothetical protein CCR75_003024 [Bremia lactucae]
MLPVNKSTLRRGLAPYRRQRLHAAVASGAALILLFFLLMLLSWEKPRSVTVRPIDVVVSQSEEAPVPAAEDGGGMMDDESQVDGGIELEKKLKDQKSATHAPFVLRLLLPLIAGYCFGFLGSMPIAGPTSAMVLRLGIQGKYNAGLTVAVGGAISEATYAGIAFWGFGSFLAGAKFLLPVSKVLGAIMFTLIGLIFLKADMKLSLDPDAEASHEKGSRRPQGVILKNILVGLTMSGINPALLASYTGAIASVYGTGMLEFTLFLAVVFAVGVCCGVSTWFYLLLFILKKYKERLKNHTIDLIMRGLGCFLLTLGLLCAKSSLDYFLMAS